MTKIYDLHCHSNLSDGILSPEALVSRAKTQKVTTLSLTDHDTLAGVQRAQAQSLIEGIEFIPGIEFSSLWAGRGVHIVGLNIDPSAKSIVDAVFHQRKVRMDRAVEIGLRLENHGIESAYIGAKRIADADRGTDLVSDITAEDGVLGRPHFAKYLVQEGYVSNMNQAFKRYLGAGKPGDIKQVWPEIGDVVEWINGSGGCAVLAHPLKYKMTRTKLRALVSDFADVGGGALELISGKQPPGQAEDMAKIAIKYDLKGSCGSDFHVPGQAWQELGAFGQMPRSVEPVWSEWQGGQGFG